MNIQNHRHLSRFFIAVASVAALSTPAFATTDTWAGSNGSDWATALSWTYSAGTGPVATGDSLVFGSTTTGAQTLGNTLATGISISGITFNAGTGTFIMNGNSFNLTGNITNSSSNLQTFSETGGVTESTSNVIAVTSTGGISITTGLTETGVAGLTNTVNGAGGTLTLGSLTLNSGATASVTDTFNGSGNVNITGAITNGSAFANGLTFNGTGTYTLGGANTYTGATSLTAGTININNAAALGSGAVSFGNGITLNNTSGAAITTQTNAPTFTIGGITVNFTGTNALNLGTGAVSLTSGNNTFALSGTNSTLTFGGQFTNTTNAANQTTVNGAGDTLVIGSYALNSGATAIIDTFTGTGNVNVTGAVTNGGTVANALTYIGSGTLTLGGVDTYTGLTTIGGGVVKITGTNTTAGATALTAGILAINNAGALGSGALTITGGSLDNTSGTAITSSTNNPTIALNGNLGFSTSAGTASNNLNTGTGAVSIGADRTVTLNGAGQLTFGGVLTNTADGIRTLTVNTGTGTTSNSALVLGGGYALTGTGSTAARQDVITGSGNVNITGVVSNGVTALSGLTHSGSGTLTLSGANTFTGNLVDSAGTVAIGADSTSSGGVVTSGPAGTGYLVLAGGTIIASGGSHTVGNNIAIGADAAGTIGGSQNLTLSGLMDLNVTTTGAGSHYTTIAVTNTGLTTFSGGINIHNNQLTFNNSGNILINSVIYGTSQFLAYSGTGSLTLSAANTYTLTTDAYQGYLIAGTNSLAATNGAFGYSGTINLGSASLTGQASILTNGAYTIGRAISETGTYTNSSLSIGSNETSGTSLYTGNISLNSGTTATSTILTSSGTGNEVGGIVNFNDIISGAYNVTIGGGGIVQLSGANTFGSATANANSITISGGSTLATPTATASTSTAFGKAGNELIFNNGIYQYNAGGTAFDLSASRTLDFASGGAVIDTEGLNVTFASAVGNSDTGGLTLKDFNGTPGSLTLSGVNTYTGGTTIASGTLIAGATTAAGATNGALGSTSGGLTVNGGGLNLNGNNQSVGNLTGTGGSIYNNGGGTNTLSIGTGNGTGGSYAGVIKNNTNSGAGVVALTKNGTGTITLNGAETYTGATSVTSGVLAIGASGSLGGTAVTLSGTGAMQVGTLNSTASATIGTAGNGSLTINSGGTLQFANGVAGASSSTLDNLVIGSAGGGTVLTLGGGGAISFGVGSTGVDQISLGATGNLFASISGATTINLNLISALPASGSQELIAWGAAPTGGTFALGNITGNSGGPSLSLSITSAGLFLNETSVSSAYWKGTAGTSWATLSNFTTNAAGTTPRTAALDTNTSVVFNATGGTNSSNTTLDGATTINNLSYNVGGVGIAAGTGGSLLITASGSGITVNTGVGAATETISSNVTIGATQTWTVNDSLSNLAVSGNITDGGAGNGLNKAGNGSLILSGSNNTYSGPTSVIGGALNIQNAGALGGTTSISVGGGVAGAALQLSGAGFTTPATPLSLSGTGVATAVSSGVANGGALENVSGSNTYAGTISLAANASIGVDASSMLTVNAPTLNTNGNTLTLVGAGNGELSSAISSGALTMSGTGTWTIDGANTYTGTTTVNSGTLQLGNSMNGALGNYNGTTTPLTMNGGTVDINGNFLIVGNLTGSAGTITNNSSTENALYVNATSNGTYGGSITNGDGGAGIVDFNYNYNQGPFTAGTGITTLTGTNSFTGPAEIFGGALRAASNGALGTALASPSSITVDNGAALQLSNNITTTSTSTLFLTGVGLSSAGALENVSGTNTFTSPVTLYGSSTSIGADTGSTLNFSSTATINTLGGAANNLTLIGGGNGNLAGTINLGTGSLTVNSSGTWTPGNTNTTGTWTLSAADSFNGSYVTNGTLAYTSASVLAGTGAVTLGSTIGNTTAALNYSGSGGTVGNTLNFVGTQSVLLGNTGTGAIIYTATPTNSGGAKTIVLGNTTDTIGGSIGNLADGGGAAALLKLGGANDTWTLTGTNTYTGGTTINGGILQIASASALPTAATLNKTLTINGTATASPAILQTSGTLNLISTGAGQNFTWGANAGFSAIGGTLTVTLNGGSTLSWGSGGFSGNGGAVLAFGSSASNAQVILTNNINLNTNDQFQQSIYVAKGAGGDSTLLTGAILGGTTVPTPLATPPGSGSASGLTKSGAGTLILTNANSNYTGYTSIQSGTLVAEANSTITSANTTYTSTGVFGNGFGYYGASAPSAGFTTIYVGNNQGGGSTLNGGVNPTLMVGSATVGGTTSISNPVAIDWYNATGQVFGIGGYSDANGTFSGLVTLTNAVAAGSSFAVTQVATTGTDALNITGGITATNGGNINFANVGAVNVTTTGISNGGTNAVSVTKTGSGITTFGAVNTYTGPTTVSGGNLSLTGSTSTGLVTVGGVSGGLSTATLSGNGSIGGALTTSSANSNVAHLAAGVNTSGNFGSAGTLTIAGALTVGSGANLDIDLNSATTIGGNVNDLLSVGGALSIGGAVTVNLNALGTITAGSTTSNYYTLINGATSSTGLLASNFTAGTIVGTTDSAHFFVSGNNLDVYFSGGTALQSFVTPSALRIMAGATTTVSATLQNTATAGNNALNVSLTDNSAGGHGSVTSFSGTNPTGIAAGTSSTVSGTFTAGSAGTGTWGLTNTDANAVPTTANTSASLTVYSKSTPSLTTTSASIGLVHEGATVAAQTTSLQNASGTYVAGLQITSLGGLTNVGGQSVIAAGGSDALSASVNTSTAGAYNQTYTVTSTDDQTIAGYSSNANQNFNVTGTVYSGLMTWNGASGGSFGTNANWNDSQAAGVHAAPGLDSGFTSTDTATFDTTGAGGTVNLNGASPSLKGITFNSATGYTLAQGSGGTVNLNGGAGSASITDTLGTQVISAPVNLTTNTSVNVASVSGTAQKLTISGQISGAGGLAISGPGTTVLSNATGNTYTGPTTITGGKTFVGNTSGSATGTGTVTVGVAATGAANSGTLVGKGIITSSGLTINGGGTLASGAPSQISGTSLIPDGNGHQVGGMTLASTPVTIGSALGTANLTFDLASGTSGINNNTASGAYDFSNPNNNTTYLKLTGSTTINFAGSTSISLVDLTNTTGSNGSLSLRLASPYLLISAGSNVDYLNLVINSGTAVNPVYALSQSGASGYVVGVYTGGAINAADATSINILQYGADGVTPLTAGAGGNYSAPALYLTGGNLEVVPEPGTWALMLGGLALLVVIQRRRNKLG